MPSLYVFLFIFCCVSYAHSQGIGSGSDGNLRLCVVEGRGSYKRASKFCPVLDEEKSGVECVLGTDRLDCLRRMGKGTVDFGVFSPEDLIAAQWAEIDVLVANELRNRPRPFERSLVAVVNRRILPESKSTIHAILRGRTLCHPGLGADDRHPLSDTLSQYLESLLTEKSCNTSLSLTENRIKAMAGFFGKACKAGPWVSDKRRDVELKLRYPSLCAACGSRRCSQEDRYWGVSGALACLSEGAGDVTWATQDDVSVYFGLVPGINPYASPDEFAFLCRDGSWQPVKDNPEPCVWLNRPWPVVVAKRKAAANVSQLAYSLTNASVTVEQHWHGALAALLEANQALPEPLQPQEAPLDYLAKARGFREAYSQSGCEPPRHITICTTSVLEKNKCDWLSEAAAVYGVAPPLQCAQRGGKRECVAAVAAGECDVAVAESDWLVRGDRDYGLAAVLHEVTPIVEKMKTVVAYVKKDAAITKMADLRGKRASFPLFDGFAWHSVVNYLMKEEKKSCHDIMKNYFSEICAPGVENYNLTANIVEGLSKNCYKDGEKVLEGEIQALRALVEGKVDVAFISISTYNMYIAKLIQEPWASDTVKIVPVCPEENKHFCFLGWSNIGHMFASKNLTAMRRQEIVNVFTKLDQLFGKKYPFHSAMFLMYGPFNHKYDVLFHNDTKNMATDAILQTYPYDRIPLNFERILINKTSTDICQMSDFTKGFSVKINCNLLLLIISLVVYVISS